MISGSSVTLMISSTCTSVSCTSSDPSAVHAGYRAVISVCIAATYVSVASSSRFDAKYRFHSSVTPCFSAARCVSCWLRMDSSSSSKRLEYLGFRVQGSGFSV